MQRQNQELEPGEKKVYLWPMISISQAASLAKQKLPRDLSRRFLPEKLAEGWKLYRRGAVEAVSFNGTLLGALVSGTDSAFCVTWDAIPLRHNESLQRVSSCNCAFGKQNLPCEHLAALVLTAYTDSPDTLCLSQWEKHPLNLAAQAICRSHSSAHPFHLLTKRDTEKNCYVVLSRDLKKIIEWEIGNRTVQLDSESLNSNLKNSKTQQSHPLQTIESIYTPLWTPLWPEIANLSSPITPLPREKKNQNLNSIHKEGLSVWIEKGWAPLHGILNHAQFTIRSDSLIPLEQRKLLTLTPNAASLQAQYGLIPDVLKQLFLQGRAWSGFFQVLTHEKQVEVIWIGSDSDTSSESMLQLKMNLSLEAAEGLRKKVPPDLFKSPPSNSLNVDNESNNTKIETVNDKIAYNDNKSNSSSLINDAQVCKILDLRPNQVGGIQVQTFVKKGDSLFLVESSESPKLGGMTLLPELGLVNVYDCESPLFKRYLGWKRYQINHAEVPAFLKTYGKEIRENIYITCDPILKEASREAKVKGLCLEILSQEGRTWQLSLQLKLASNLVSLSDSTIDQESNSSTDTITNTNLNLNANSQLHSPKNSIPEADATPTVIVSLPEVLDDVWANRNHRLSAAGWLNYGNSDLLWLVSLLPNKEEYSSSLERLKENSERAVDRSKGLLLWTKGQVMRAIAPFRAGRLELSGEKNAIDMFLSFQAKQSRDTVGNHSTHQGKLDKDFNEINLKENIESRMLQDEAQGNTEDSEIPKFAYDLRPYQITGIRWLHHLVSHGVSALLADDMGLGKTHQVMALLEWLLSENRKKGKEPLFLVVCPTSVLHHWEAKLLKFHPSLCTLLHHGSERSIQAVIDGEKTVHVILTSYGIIRRDAETMANLPFDLIVLDEAQNAKNRSSGAWKAISQLQSQSWVALSGTPLENTPMEVKNLFDLILPGYFPGEAEFKRSIVEPWQIPLERWEAKRRFQWLTAPFLLRRMKSEVLKDLPAKVEEILECEMTDSQKELYQLIYQNEARPILEKSKEDRETISVTHIFQVLTKLKQICNHPETCSATQSLRLSRQADILLAEAVEKEHSQINSEERSEFNSDSATKNTLDAEMEDIEDEGLDEVEGLNGTFDGGGKWNAFVDLLTQAMASNLKVVVFSQFLAMIEHISQYLNSHSINYETLTGSTRDRKSVVERFNTDSDCKVFVCSLLAGGTGIDLTGASVVIHYDRWWTAAKEDQATDRVHRYGQQRNVQVFKFVTRNTVEEKINAIIEAKAELAAGLIESQGDEALKLLSREELLSILGNT